MINNKLDLSVNGKKIEFLLMYWLLLIVVPGYIAFSYKPDGNGFDLPGYISLYILFIAPLLFIAPYKISKLSDKKEKLSYVFLGLVLPYILIYFYLYMSFKRDFHPSF